MFDLQLASWAPPRTWAEYSRMVYQAIGVKPKRRRRKIAKLRVPTKEVLQK